MLLGASNLLIPSLPRLLFHNPSILFASILESLPIPTHQQPSPEFNQLCVPMQQPRRTPSPLLPERRTATQVWSEPFPARSTVNTVIGFCNRRFPYEAIMSKPGGLAFGLIPFVPIKNYVPSSTQPINTGLGSTVCSEPRRCFQRESHLLLDTSCTLFSFTRTGPRSRFILFLWE